MKSYDIFQEYKDRMIGVPIVTTTIAVIERLTGTANLQYPFWVCWLVAFFHTLVIWQGSLLILLYFRRLFPAFHQTKHRLIYQGLAVLLFVVLFSLISEGFLVFSKFNSTIGYFNAFLANIIPTTIVLLIYESSYFFQSWKSYIIKTESLIHENVRSQLNALKSQLDPHFLFNSLNTLASVVGEENEPAQKFLEQLADVYRYVLVSREKNTVSMKEEMAFLDAYIYLNKIRFRENLQVEKKINSATLDRSIAPLSLQLLMENALKHNAATRDSPLKITIAETDDGYIVVENNIQEKKILEKSTKLGLENIVNRYKLLTSKEVFIIKDQTQFTVKIPLLSA